MINVVQILILRIKSNYNTDMDIAGWHLCSINKYVYRSNNMSTFKISIVIKVKDSFPVITISNH